MFIYNQKELYYNESGGNSLESKRKYLCAVIIVCLMVPMVLAETNNEPGSQPMFSIDNDIVTLKDGYPDMVSYNDHNNNRVADGLEEIIASKRSVISVIVLLTGPPTDDDLENFAGYGGVLTKGPWADVIYGFAGDMHTDNIYDYASSCHRILEIEEENDFDYHLYITSNMVRARNYVFSDLGYTGSLDTSLAIIDTGIDPDHTAFAPGYLGEGDFDGKIVGWHDASGTDPEPHDDGGHGQHVAGIASAQEFAEIDTEGRLVTHHGWSTTLGEIEYPEPPVIYVDEPGEVEVNFAYLADVNSGDITYVALKYLGEVPEPAVFDGNTEYIVNWEEAARFNNPVQTPNLKTSTDRNWNTLTYDVDSSSLGFYRVVTYRTSISAGLGQGMRYVFKIHNPTSWADAEGSAPDGYGTFTGIAPDSKLVMVSGGMFVGTSTWVDGLDYIVANREALHITTVSMSLGTGSDSSSVKNAIYNTWNSGIMIVAAAGNAGPGGSISYPARYTPVIGVAATQAGGNLSYYSSNGLLDNGDGYTKPDIAAPGGSIRYQGGVMSAGTYTGYPPTQWGHITTDIESMYGFQGTSQATPAVAGATMLVVDSIGGWEEYNSAPHHYKRLVKSSLLMTATETAVPREMYTFETGGPSVNRGLPDIHEGYGFMNIDAAIESLTRELNIGQGYSSYITTINHTWESDLNLDNNYGRKAWAGNVYLEAGEDYDFYLDVPSTADFDLYLYGPPDQYGYPEIIDISNTSAMGADEHINYTSSAGGRYYVVVKGVYGHGSFHFSYTAPGHLGITVTQPNGGEVWEIGTQENITWTTIEGAYPIDSVDLWYSIDAGDTWTTIDSGLPDTGSYTWTIPDTTSLECKVRALVRDTGGMTNEDTSDGYFAILGDPVEVTLISPNGGEIWTAGDTETISWNTDEGDNTVIDVDLEYSSNGGETWNVIDTGLPDTGGYSWQIPNVASGECLVRVTVHDDLGFGYQDMSDGYFEIVGIPPAPPLNLMVEHHGPIGTLELFEEDFTGVDTGTIPVGWTKAPDTAHWRVENTNRAGGVAPELEFYYSPSETSIRRCYTPVIDSTWFTELELSFRHFLDDYGSQSRYTLRVETSSDGSNWDEIWSIESPIGDIGPELVTIPFTHNVGSDTLYISWTFDGNSYDMWRWDIDDIILTGEGGEGDEHNLLTWDASPNDPAEVSHYNIYRSEDYGGPWDESTFIDSVSADGSSNYTYLDENKGTADEILWWYIVRAVGANGMEEGNENAVQEPGAVVVTFDIPLYAGGDADGWNFVSFNLIPADISLITILDNTTYGISGNYDRVMYYDASAGEWRSYVPGRGDRYNTLDTWDHRMGVWIRMVTSDTLTVVGTAPATITITLYPGWNMVGLPASASGNHGLPGDVDKIGYFDATQTYNLAYDHDPGSFVFESGNGYWIHNPTDTAIYWEVTY